MLNHLFLFNLRIISYGHFSKFFLINILFYNSLFLYIKQLISIFINYNYNNIIINIYILLSLLNY